MEDITIAQLLNVRKQVIQNYRLQKDRFTNDVDYLIGEQLRKLRRDGVSTEDLQRLIGSKDYRTLKHYLDHKGNLPLPERLQVLPRVDGEIHMQSLKREVRGVDKKNLMDYLTINAKERTITAMDVPLAAWTLAGREKRPDLYPVQDGYNGWAIYNDKGIITERSEPKSPLLAENKFGVLTPTLLKETQENAQN